MFYLVLTGYLGVVVAYHLLLAAIVRFTKVRTTQQKLADMRHAWVDQIRSKNSILAVQTLRNWNMSSTFLASASLIIASGLLSVVFSQQLDRGIEFEALDYLHHQLFAVAFCFIAAFLNFSLCLRAFNHAGYLSEVSATPDHSDAAIGKMLRRILQSGARHYTLGMRCFYLSVPLALWLFGLPWLLVATVLLLGFLYYVDMLSA